MLVCISFFINDRGSEIGEANEGQSAVLFSMYSSHFNYPYIFDSPLPTFVVALPPLPHFRQHKSHSSQISFDTFPNKQQTHRALVMFSLSLVLKDAACEHLLLDRP